jgi:hypothetical protein
MRKKSDTLEVEKIKVWQGQIDYLRVANNKLRDRLATAIIKDVDIAFLEQAEHFNHKFMEMDQIIELMRHEIAGLSVTAAHTASGKTSVSFLRLRQDMERCEKEFHILEQSFLSHLEKLDY